MFLKLNIIRNKFQEVLGEAEKNYRLCRSGGFDISAGYVHGIFLAMCVHDKIEYLPENNIDRMVRLGCCPPAVLSHAADYGKSMSEEERMEIISELFSETMEYVLCPDIVLEYYGALKGILFVMKELGTVSYLDKKMVRKIERMEKSVAEMIETSDGSHGNTVL